MEGVTNLNSLKDFASSLACPLCHELLRSPCTFSTCGHTFCHGCVIARLEGPGISTSQCPTCKQPGWKNDLRPNHLIQNAVEHVRGLLQLFEQQDLQNAAAAAPLPATEAAQPSSSGAEPQLELLEAVKEGKELAREPSREPEGAEIEMAEAQSAAPFPAETDEPAIAVAAEPLCFGPDWEDAQLAAGPPATEAGLHALRQEVALLEAALQLCDTLPCCAIAVAELPDPDSVQAAMRKKASRKLSDVISQQAGEEAAAAGRGEEGAVAEDCAGEPESEVRPTAAEVERIGIVEETPLRGGETASGTFGVADAAAAAGEGGPGAVGCNLQNQRDVLGDGSTGRRRVRRRMEAAEAAAERAFAVARTIEPRALAKEDDAKGKNSAAVDPRPSKSEAVVGGKVAVVWQDGEQDVQRPFFGTVVGSKVEKGVLMHEICYEDGDDAWHNLDDEQWWAVTAGEGQQQQCRVVERRQSDGECMGRYAGAAIGVIPDSQDVEMGEEAEAAAGAAAARWGFGMIDTQGAIETLQQMRGGGGGGEGGGFVMASQLPLEALAGSAEEKEAVAKTAEPPKQPSQPFGLSFPAPVPLGCLGGGPAAGGSAGKPFLSASSQGLGRSSQTPSGGSGTKRRGSSQQNTADIRKILLSQQQKKAEAAARVAPIRLAFSGKDEGVEATAVALQKVLPGLQFGSELTENTTHVVVPTDDALIAKRRSRLYLEALARGCWVVSSAWLDACLQEKARVSEGPFEVQGCDAAEKTTSKRVHNKSVGGPERSRTLAGRGRKLFANRTVAVAEFSGKSNTHQLRALVTNVLTLGGARVVEIKGHEGRDGVVVTDDAEFARGLAMRKFINVVKPHWALESVACCEVLPLDAYRFREGDS